MPQLSLLSPNLGEIHHYEGIQMPASSICDLSFGSIFVTFSKPSSAENKQIHREITIPKIMQPY